jgi:hypothetical protein
LQIHVLLPAVEFEPKPHIRHVVSDDDPFTTEYLPASHAIHDDDPFTTEYLPGSHATQSVNLTLPGASTYLPAGQLSHVAPDVDPSTTEYFPGSQITSRGSAPFAAPYSAVAGFVIADTAIEPTLFASVADKLTSGDDCAEAGFVKLKVTAYAFPDVGPPNAAVSTSCPVLCVHAPVVPRRLDVDVTAKLSSAVCEPVSPVIVTVEPAARL